MKDYVVYKCKTCKKTFILLTEEVRFNDSKGNYISCPFKGHRNIAVTGTYDSIRECMDNSVYVREGRRMRQIK